MKDFLKPRTIFAFMFYGAFLYLVIMEKQIPQELVLVVGSIQGFYWGKKASDIKKVQNGS